MTIDRKPEIDVERFEEMLAQIPDGYSQGLFGSSRWGATMKRSPDGKRTWLYAEDLGGDDIVSLNVYRLSSGQLLVKPCEMSIRKVEEFVLNFRSDGTAPGNGAID